MSKLVRSVLSVLALILGFTATVEKLSTHLRAEKMGPGDLATSNGEGFPANRMVTRGGKGKA